MSATTAEDEKPRKPAPTPFVLPLRTEGYLIWDARGLPIGQIDLPGTAAHFVHCVNVHGELAEIVRGWRSGTMGSQEAMLAILAKVKP